MFQNIKDAIAPPKFWALFDPIVNVLTACAQRPKA